MTAAGAISSERSVDDAVARLAADDPLPKLLGRDQGWRRSYGRLDPLNETYATLVYEAKRADPMRVELSWKRRTPTQFRVTGLGWAATTPFTNDATLASLPRVIARYPGSEVVRYRPGKRCTLRATEPESDDGIYLKVLADARGDRLFADACMLQANSTQLGFAIAPPIEWNAQLRTLIHSAVPGHGILERLHGRGGPTLAGGIGAALGSIVNAPLAPSARFAAGEQMMRSAKYARKLARALPSAAAAADTALTMLARAHEATPDTPLRPVHGAPHPHQWLENDGGLVLVDFDRLSLGPIEIDAATFLAELDFEDSESVPIDAVNEAFIESYARVAGPINARLLAIYRAHKNLAKALKRALALHPDRGRRAHTALAGLVRILGEC